jgi:predicted O-methyltransferase YrrM
MNKQEIINHAISFQYGGQSYNELAYLYDICVDKNVLELGSMVGMSSYVIASVAKSLSCVDVWSDTQDHLSHDQEQAKVYASLLPGLPNMFESFNKNCKEFIESDKIKMYKGNTHDLVNEFLDNNFDVVFIDADHSYQGVSIDFSLYYSKVKPDGFIVFHDYGDSMWTGIKLFCDEMVAQNKIKFINQVERVAIFSL